MTSPAINEAALPDVGDRLLRALKKARVSQIRLARAAGVPQEGLNKFVKGHRGLQADRLVAVLAAASELGVSLDYVLRDIGPELRPPAIYTDDPRMAEALLRLADRLDVEPLGGGESVPRQLPAPAKKRPKK